MILIGESKEYPYYIDIKISGKSFFKNLSNESYDNKKLFEAELNNFLNKYNMNYFSCNVDLIRAAKTVNEKNIDPAKCYLVVTKKSGDINVNSGTGLVNSINFTAIDDSFWSYNHEKNVPYNVQNADYFKITIEGK